MSDISFKPANLSADIEERSRPSLSYWQDAWMRLKANKRAFVSLFVVLGLIVFAFLGPLVWRVDPDVQDLDQASKPPWAGRDATIVEPLGSRQPVTVAEPTGDHISPRTLEIIGDPSTTFVRLVWDAVPNAFGYRIYRHILKPKPGEPLGLPLGTVSSRTTVSYDDQMDVKPVRYWYSVVAIDSRGDDFAEATTIPVLVKRTTTPEAALNRGWISDADSASVGDAVKLEWHPLGTDYLGRDMLARLMKGAQVSLFIGIAAPFLFVIAGVIYGSAAGFLGGNTDHVLMRFADFVIALPFLLFMILFKFLFGIGPGESGIMPMLVALVLLSWPAAARLVRGEILKIREEGYVEASRLLGTKTGRLIFRHMIPNTMGVVLVTFTFAVPSAIFTEAFLSFIGMGVTAPTASWGSMCNDGIKTMETTPHELLFPALFISITVLAFNLLGDGLRDALDARMRYGE